MNYIIMLVSILLGACAQIFMKMGAMKEGSFLIKFISTPYLILGLFLYGISAICWIYALSKVQLSYAYPLVSLGYVIVFILSFFLLHEQLSVLRVAGLVVIVVGVLMIAKS